LGAETAPVKEKDHAKATTSLDKTMVANCPTGRVLLGMGYQIDNAGGEVLVESMQPLNLNRVSVLAREEDAFTGTWRLSAIAVCADPSVSAVVVSGSSITALATHLT
jgi:hypothetical protein